MFRTLGVKAAGIFEGVARGLRATVHPNTDWTEALNDMFYGDSDEDYDDFCPVCTYTSAAKDTDCERCPFC